jgi:hypothetical protein
MPFIGNQPALSYTSFAKQDFTTSATTSYILDQPVANANELALFINFVRQEPTTAYTASGTTLTLTSATSATDDMYCVFLGKAVQTVNPPNGSVGTAQIASSLDFSSKTITLASNMKNTPAFVAYKTSNQSLSNLTSTKITFTGEQLDTNSNYDTVNSSFTPSIAGYYFIGAFWRYDSGTNFSSAQWILKKNGTSIQTRIGYNDLSGGYNYNYITYANGTDYFEMFGYQNSGVSVDVNGSGSYQSNATQAYFYGYRLIGA